METKFPLFLREEEREKERERERQHPCERIRFANRKGIYQNGECFLEAFMRLRVHDISTHLHLCIRLAREKERDKERKSARYV